MKHIFIMFAVALLSTTAYCQQGDKEAKKEARKERKEQIEAMKIGYMTQTLELTAAQSADFWALYNEYDRAMHKVFKERKQLHRRIEKGEATKANVEALLNSESKMVELRRDYFTRFMGVLEEGQASKIFFAEDKFKEELVRSLRKKK